MKRIVIESDEDGVIAYVSGDYEWDDVYGRSGCIYIEDWAVYKDDVDGEEMWAYECSECGNEFVSKQLANCCPVCGSVDILLLE